MCLAKQFLKCIPLQSVLEIGPFGRPRLKGDHVSYFDVLDQPTLIARARARGRADDCPFIDYVSPTGDLSVVTEKFHSIFASHALEHQPNLVRHLQQVEQLLLPDGRYWLILPDKRYCFDHYRSITSLADVLGAWMDVRQVHTYTHVFEHRILTTHNDAKRHWAGEHGETNMTAERVKSAMAEIAAADGGYIDVHAWRFTPESFRALITQLADLGLIGLRPVRVYNTPRDRQEFCAVLEAAPHQKEDSSAAG